MEDDSSAEKKGCGLLNVLGRRWPRRSSSTNSSSTSFPNIVPPSPNYKRRNSDAQAEDSAHKDRIISRPSPRSSKPSPTCNQQTPPIYIQNQGTRKAPERAHVAKSAPAQGYVQNRKVPQGALGLSGELDSMINDHQRTKGSAAFVRASSGNVMLYGDLGNLRQGKSTVNNNNYDYQPKNVEIEQKSSPKNVISNVVKKENDVTEKPTTLCRAISTRMDPERLKIMGNEDYKNGRFEEALALYDAAISIDPNKASYRGNKSAALTALGRLLEAVLECREAIRIEPFYQRAHNRLAMLYLRLGDAEKAMYHYKHAGSEAEPEFLQKAKNVQAHLNKCTEAKRHRDWNTLLKETTLAISAAADSAPQLFALKAEALLKLHKHQEADETLKNGPKFDVDECTKFFGPIGNATLLLIRAQVDMALGRFDEAVAAAQQAARLDSNNKEVGTIVRRTKAVAAARSNGNEFFKAGNYTEACIAYGEGLNYDPHNSVLLSNRAACRSKLGQYEKALEDCNGALNLRPNFIKARLRRADCYTKMKKWEGCIQDCEILARENPDDEEVVRMLKEAQTHLGK